MRNTLVRRPTSLFDTFLGDDMLTGTYGSNIDIYKDGSNYKVEVEMPGFNKEDIDVQFNGDILSIKAEHQESEENDEKNYYYRSRRMRSVNRQIRFADVDEKGVDAHYEKGVLHVTLPTRDIAEVSNRIEIK